MIRSVGRNEKKTLLVLHLALGQLGPSGLLRDGEKSSIWGYVPPLGVADGSGCEGLGCCGSDHGGVHTGPAHPCTHGECGACKVAAGPLVPTFLPSPHVPILPLAQARVLFTHILFSVGLSPMWLGDIWQPWR